MPAVLTFTTESSIDTPLLDLKGNLAYHAVRQRGRQSTARIRLLPKFPFTTGQSHHAPVKITKLCVYT
ncbi:hypothetical protein [Rhodanobacter sp. BL-MT-08]